MAIEINFLLSGTMDMRIDTEFKDSVSKTLVAGDIFVIYPNEIATPTFLTDCTLIVVKTPSIPNDKVIVE